MAKNKETKPKTINADLDPETHRMLKIACAASGLNFSQAVTQAVKQWAKGVVS